MKAYKLLLLLLLALLLTSCGRKPDTIYVNGKFYTLDKDNTIVDAVATGDGKIIALGKSMDLSQKYPKAKVVDLNGKTVVPGFIDAEGNLMEFSRNLNFIDLRGTKTLAEILSKVSERLHTAKENEWVGGFGWDDQLLSQAELDKIDHHLLDSLSTKQYLYLVNSRADMVWVNKKMMEASGINKNTPNPEDGEIEKDDKGEPTGILYDDAQELIMKVLPKPTIPEIERNIMRGNIELFRYGITEVCDANISEDILNVYKKMVDENNFLIRLYVMLNGKDSLFGTYIQKGPETYKDHIIIKSVFLEYDGYFETQDAAMENDYIVEPHRKTPYNDEYDIREMTKKAFEKNFQVSIKANGDRAVTATLRAIDSVSKDTKNKAGRTRIEYVEFVPPQDMQKIKQLEIIPSIRPEVTLENKRVINDIINSDNGKNLGLWSTLLKQNGMIMAGSDFPYHQINPLYQMYMLSTGLPIDTSFAKTANNVQQKLSVLDALKAFTVWAAYGCFEDDVKGTLEPGKLADMVVLSNDILESDPKVLLNTNVLMTIIRGDIVYNSHKPAAMLIRN